MIRWTAIGLAMMVGGFAVAQEQRGRERDERQGGEQVRQRPDAGRGVREGDRAGMAAWAPIREFLQAQREVMQAFFQEVHEENRLFREGLRGTPPGEAIPKIVEHRKAQFAKMIDFLTAKRGEAVAFVTGALAEAEVPEERTAEWVERTEARFERYIQMLTERHEQFLARLNELAGKDAATWEDLAAIVRDELPLDLGQERRGRGARGEGAPGDGARPRIRGERPERPGAGRERPERPERPERQRERDNQPADILL